MNHLSDIYSVKQNIEDFKTQRISPGLARQSKDQQYAYTELTTFTPLFSTFPNLFLPIHFDPPLSPPLALPLDIIQVLLFPQSP